MFVKMKTACVTCPLEVASGAARFAIGAKNARKMCDIESIKKTRSTGLLPAGASVVGMCFDHSEAFSECQRGGKTSADYTDSTDSQQTAKAA